MVKKMLILSSGGDAPGMNAAIRAVVRSAIANGISIFGVQGGYNGLINHHIHLLDQTSVANCIQRGGTILKTARCEDFYRPEVRKKSVDFLNDNNFDGLIILGGNGSFQGAVKLNEEGGPRCIGIPCTIDNDIPGTEYAIGFDTACNTAIDAIDKIRDTAFSLDRNFMIEVMGRSSGFIAVDVGIAGGAELIIIPEFQPSVDEIIAKLQQTKRPKLASIVVVAEGGQAGHTMKLAEEIQKRSGIRYTVCILGHIQRGGTPTVRDRKIASIMGVKAVEALIAGLNCQMVSLINEEFTVNPFPVPGQTTRFFQDQNLLDLNRIICDAN